MSQAAPAAEKTAAPADKGGQDRATAGIVRSHSRSWLRALFVLVLALKAVVPFIAHDGLKHRDPDGYWRLAKNLWNYNTFGNEYVPTAYRPPLYPLLLTPAAPLGNRAWLAIAGLHAVLGLLTVLLTWDLARDLAPEAAWLAALLVAWDPLLVRWSAEIMTETLAAFLAILFWIWCQQAGRSALGALMTGLVAGMAALTRPTFLPMLPVAALLAIFTAPSRTRGLLYGVLLLVGGMMLLGPWWVRNERVFHRFIPATTHGGYTLYLGNNPEFYAHIDEQGWRQPWSSHEFDRRVIERRHAATLSNEVDHDRAEYALAWQSIRNAPTAFLRACAFRLSRLWGLMPLPSSAEATPAARIARWIIAGYYAVVLLLTAAGLAAVVRRRRLLDWLPGLLLVACFTVVHTLYWADMRMRAPLVPIIALLAAHVLSPAAWAKGGVRQQ